MINPAKYQIGLIEVPYSLPSNGKSNSVRYTFEVNSKIIRFVNERKRFEFCLRTAQELYPNKERMSGTVPKMKPFEQVNRQLQSLNRLIQKKRCDLTSLELAITLVQKRMMYITRNVIIFLCEQLKLRHAIKLQTMFQNVDAEFAASPETCTIVKAVLRTFSNSEGVVKSQEDVKNCCADYSFEFFEEYFLNKHDIDGVAYIYNRIPDTYASKSGRYFVQELIEKEVDLLNKHTLSHEEKELISEKIIYHLFSLSCKTASRNAVLVKVDELIQTKYTKALPAKMHLNDFSFAVQKYVQRHYEDTDILNMKANKIVKKTADEIIIELRNLYEEEVVSDVFQTCLEFPDETIAYAQHVFNLWTAQDLTSLLG